MFMTRLFLIENKTSIVKKQTSFLVKNIHVAWQVQLIQAYFI